VIEVDGVRRRAFDLPGRFRVTLFWPDDLGLVKAGPELRRRFLNQMLVQVEPGYGRALAGLKRVLEQRNSLLKKIAAGEESLDVLEAFNQELVRLGGEVVFARSSAVRELEPEVAMYHAQISGRERLEIHYGQLLAIGVIAVLALIGLAAWTKNAALIGIPLLALWLFWANLFGNCCNLAPQAFQIAWLDNIVIRARVIPSLNIFRPAIGGKHDYIGNNL